MKVSAIVTSYNHAEYLDQRMQSLLAQSYQPLQIIVVDDCSQDNSLAVLEKYKNLPNVTIVALEENGGYANACNVGVSMASGDYIIFSECDDYCESNQIAKLLEKFDEGSSIGVVYSSSNIVNEKGDFLFNDFIGRENKFKNQCIYDCLIKSEKIQMYFAVSCVVPNMSAALIKKDLFFLCGKFSDKYKICADWDFWCRLSRICDFYYIRKPYNNFRTHPKTVRNLSKADKSATEIMNLLYDHYRKMNKKHTSRIRFLFGMSRIIVGLSLSNPRKFPRIYYASISYDKLNIVAPVIGIISIVLRKIRG